MDLQKPLKLLAILILLIVVIYWGGQATLKLYNNPIGTKLEYRVGDDNQGNIHLFALTICPPYFAKYKVLQQENLSVYQVDSNIRYLRHQIHSGQNFADNEAN